MSGLRKTLVLSCFLLLTALPARAANGCDERPEKPGDDPAWTFSFGKGEAELSPNATDMLWMQALLAVLKACPDLPVKLVGFGDIGADQEANVTLAGKRLEWVRSHLAGKGVAAERISLVNRAGSSFGRKRAHVEVWYERPAN